MGPAVLRSEMSGEAFLAWEALQTERHDFVAGEVFAMAGAEDRHVTATGNVYMALRSIWPARPAAPSSPA